MIVFILFFYLFIPKAFKCIFKQTCMLGKAMHDGAYLPAAPLSRRLGSV